MAGIIRRLLLSWFGWAFDASVNGSTVTVGTSVVQVHKFNPARLCANFSNSSTGIIALSHNPAMTLADGYQLAAGQSCGFDWQTDYQRPGEAWYAIGNGAGLTLFTETQVLTGEQDSDPVPGL